MIDYIQTNIKGVAITDVFNNPLLEFTCAVNLSTGELLPCNKKRKKDYLPNREERTANYNNLTITLINNIYIRLEGSLHEQFHDGNNSGDFTSKELATVLHNIATDLNTSLDAIKLHNLEFGVNIKLPFPPKQVLDSLFCFKGHSPEVVKRYNSKGHLVKFIFKQYELKIYDKGKQYGLSDNILRIEVKVRKMQFLSAKGIKIVTLQDLLNTDYYAELGKILIDFINSLVITEPKFETALLTKNEKRILMEFDNPRYWLELWRTNQDNYRKRKTLFSAFIQKHGRLKIQEKLVQLCAAKWNELTKSDNCFQSKTRTEITEFEKHNPYGNYPSNSMLFPYESTTGQKTCATCGRDITSQRFGSKFCSEKLYGKEVKSCRNKDSNPRNNFKRRELRDDMKGLYLFDNRQFLQPNNHFKTSVNYRINTDYEI